MKILLLAGEESGLHYANRLRRILSARGHEVRGYADYGFETSSLAVMGFAAVMRRLPFFIGVRRTMRRAICEWRPDVVCTIDYPGMNLGLSAFAKSLGTRAVHVVCPQVWAWKADRIPKIERSLDALCCFFPFEPALFRPGFARFVGHPLVEEFEDAGTRRPRRARLVAMLPGSRIGEIERCLPVMLDALDRLPGDVRAEIPAANAAARGAIERIIAGRRPQGAEGRIRVLDRGARELLMRAECGVVASGTATLEAALARCPSLLVYRVSAALAWFVRRVVKGVSNIGLVNVVWEKSGGEGEKPMPELLQEEFTAERVAGALGRWLSDAKARSEASARLDGAVRLLGNGGPSAYSLIVEAIEGDRGRGGGRRA